MRRVEGEDAAGVAGWREKILYVKTVPARTSWYNTTTYRSTARLRNVLSDDGQTDSETTELVHSTVLEVLVLVV